jgi:uncharacterized protein
VALSLHPTLSMQLIRLFHDPATNPAGAQLVFTSHDTSLLNHLNRDEVWLTEKTEGGATRLGALAEFAGERVRRSRISKEPTCTADSERCPMSIVRSCCALWG